MAAERVVIPFERQFDVGSSRACGAACLAMVYRSLGKVVAQDEIWRLVAKRLPSGSLASTTHLMVRDAQRRGFSAVAIQARHPLQALRLCRDGGVPAILNTRLQPNSQLGHYVVLVDMDERDVIVHDPYFGPERRMPHAELLKLWQAPPHGTEITGNVLIGIAGTQTPPVTTCPECHTAQPTQIHCPRCKEVVPLAPQALLGCVADACILRMWNYLCCPACDFMWTFGLTRPDEKMGQAAAEDADMWKLAPAFEAIDRFAALVLSRPYAANPELVSQLDYIVGSKLKLRLAMAEAQANLQVQRERMTVMAQAARQADEAHRNRMRAATTPLASLDGAVLTDALLKNLGFLA